MTLREIINSVVSDQYSDSALYQKLHMTKPEYGVCRHIQVNAVHGDIVVTNCHVGSLGDILTYPIDVAPGIEHLESAAVGCNTSRTFLRRLYRFRRVCLLG